MDPQKFAKTLYYLRYKEGNQGVQASLIAASSPAIAEQVGHAYCSQRPNRRFIRIDPAVVADESILSPNEGAPEEPQDVPNNGAQLSDVQMATGGLVEPGTGAGSAKKRAAA